MSSIVVNSGCAEGGVRLTGGKTETEGRVEVCHNQTWWAISGRSYYWDVRDATVVCKHLHYPSNCELTHGGEKSFRPQYYRLYNYIHRGNSLSYCCTLWKKQCHNTCSGPRLYWSGGVTSGV